MSAIQLHQTLPEASSTEYAPFQTVDFLISAPGRKLVILKQEKITLIGTTQQQGLKMLMSQLGQ